MTVMLQVGVIILYDHVHPVGAFAKNAPIDVSHNYTMINTFNVIFSVNIKHMVCNRKDCTLYCVV